MKRHSVLLLVILLTVAADQGTKHLAPRYAQHRPRRFGPLTLTYAENRGAFLSVGENLPESLRTSLFDGVVAVGLVALSFVLFRRAAKRPDDTPLALIIGGGIGNLIDRLRFGGKVIDFLYLRAGPLHTGVFNIADLAITAAAIWLLILWGFLGRLHREA